MTKTTADNDALVEDEWYAVRYSGEIPEVAFHCSIHHLTSDADGPQLELTPVQHHYLVDAAKQRYIDIVLRDLLPENKHTGSYRGVMRSLINWKRFVLFCERFLIDQEPFLPVIGEALSEFLEYECREGGDASQVRLNCTWTDLLEYCGLLGLDVGLLPDGCRGLCVGQGTHT